VFFVHACFLAECLALVQDPQGLLGQCSFVTSGRTAPDVAFGHPLQHPHSLDTPFMWAGT
jgi:hypothetical protein